MEPASSILYPFVFFNFGVLIYLFNLKYSNGYLYLSKRLSYRSLYIILCLLLSVFATYDGDWWHYKENVEELYNNPEMESHMETIHVFIMGTFSFGFNIIWRLIIWSLQLLFIYLSFRRLKMDNLLTWVTYTILFCAYYSSLGRVGLASSIQFYGLSCLIMLGKRKFLSFCNGLIWIAISLFFHKSVFITVLPALIALVPQKKYFILFYFLFIPLLVPVFQYYLADYLLNSSDVNGSVMRYVNEETEARGIGIQMFNYIFRVTLFGTYFTSLYEWLRGDYLPRFIKVMIVYTTFILMIYLIIYLSLTFIGIGSSDIATRVLIMATFPNVILYSYLFSEKKHTIILGLLGLLSIIAINYRIFYAYYLYNLGVGI